VKYVVTYPKNFLSRQIKHQQPDKPKNNFMKKTLKGRKMCESYNCGASQ